MSIMPGTERLKTWVGQYDFLTDTGAQATYTLRSADGPIPKGAVVVGGYVDVTSACLSAAGTMALQVEGANDIVNAVGQASWGAARRDIIPDSTGSTAVKTTAARDPKLVIAGADFTAGNFVLVLFYR